MSENSNLLFVRGDGTDDEAKTTWDDTVLIQAYDKAVNMAKEEVAKRIARDSQGQQSRQKPQNSKYQNQTKKPFKQKWSVGSPCRAVYSVDEQIYEAIITKIFENSGACMVKFIGYNNTEKVELDSLLESNGLESQVAQQKNALLEKSEQAYDSDVSNYSAAQSSKQMNGEKMDCDTEDPRLFKSSFMEGPSFDMSINGIPPPPPLPPQLMAKLPENDTDALSSMLMSWYISGFHTGYYHGMKQANLNGQKRKNC